jgi:hypothetical protein
MMAAADPRTTERAAHQAPMLLAMGCVLAQLGHDRHLLAVTSCALDAEQADHVLLRLVLVALAYYPRGVS